MPFPVVKTTGRANVLIMLSKRLIFIATVLFLVVSVVAIVYLQIDSKPISTSIQEKNESLLNHLDPIKIDFTEAGKHTGEYATVRTPVKYQFNNGKYLIFSSRVNPHHTYMVQDENDRNGFFTVRILIDDLHKFPEDFGQQILNKEVEVTGVLTWYQSDPHLIVESPDQIKIL